MRYSRLRRGCHLFLFIVVVFWSDHVFSQDFNLNPNLTFINHNTPRSPESASLEKYGTLPAGSSSGIPVIGIPLYNVSGQMLNSPVTLSYHASGIKVNQEATWVGLGWDISAGGRITLEIKGGWDKYVKQMLDYPGARNTIAHLFSRYVNSASTNSHKVDGSSICGIYYVPDASQTDFNEHRFPYCGPLDADSVAGSEYFQHLQNIYGKGIGEPDMFHANFMDKSFTFYRDLFTDSIKIKGQENLFKIQENILGTYSNTFVITDEAGIKYHFDKEEKTFYLPYLEGLFSSATSAWLLTKVVHPNGDWIEYDYTSYGQVLSAPAISESETSSDGQYTSSTNTVLYGLTAGQTMTFHEPQYMTRIRTKETDVNFILGQRKDIAGDGARRLDKIQVQSRLNNQVFQEIKFNYDYFNSNGYGYYHFDTVRLRFGSWSPDNNVYNHLNLRLKLLSVDVYGTDSTIAKTHHFYYRDGSLNALPTKVSLSQDHWGYYNGNNQSSTVGNIHFTPSLQSLLDEGLISTFNVSVWMSFGGPTNLNINNIIPGRRSRAADTLSLSAAGWVLDSIVYPTGGSTKYEFELHRSHYVKKFSGELIGGGLRIKRVKSYNNYNGLNESRRYEYETPEGVTSGIYQGNLDYLQISNDQWMGEYMPNPSIPKFGYDRFEPRITLFSNGNLSEGGNLILYSRVREIINEGSGGWAEKNFNVYNPSTSVVGGTYPITTHMYLPPLPAKYVHGEATSEKYYDQTGTLKKEVSFFYRQIDKTDKFYNLKSSLRYHYLPQHNTIEDEYIYMFTFQPMHSYYLLLDSTVEKNYENGQLLTRRQKLKYNPFYQPEYVSGWNSTGDEIIVQTRTPLSFSDIPLGAGELQRNAQAISYMRFHNILTTPIEKVVMSRNANGDTVVLHGAYNVYDPVGNIRETYLLNSATPVPSTQFLRSYYGGVSKGYDMVPDTRYLFDKSVKYMGLEVAIGGGHPVIESGRYVKEVMEKEMYTAIVNDTIANTVIAVCQNAKADEVAFSSFETASTGYWSYSGSSSLDATSPSGSYCYNMAGGAISKAGMNSADTYVVSYWTKNNSAYSITGTVSGSVLEGATRDGWKYFEHKVTGQSTISLSGSGYIDELRLYPANGLMKTYTYDKIRRMVTEMAANNSAIHYEYDASNRLSLVRDQDKNIIRKVSYKYAGQKVNFDGEYYLSNVQSGLWTKNNCPDGVPQQILYAVPEGKYKSTVSQADADLQAVTDLNANGQTYANQQGGCQFYNIYQEAVFVQNNCPANHEGKTVTYRVQPNRFISLVSQADANAMAAAELAIISGNGQAEANLGICVPLVTLNCNSTSFSETYNLELKNNDTQKTYNFTISAYGPIGQVPEGTYFVRINGNNYTTSHTYVINNSIYKTGVVVTFDNVSISTSSTVTFGIY